MRGNMKPSTKKLRRYNNKVKIDYEFIVNCREYFRQIEGSEYADESGETYNGAVYKDLWLTKLLA